MNGESSIVAQTLAEIAASETELVSSVAAALLETTLDGGNPNDKSRDKPVKERLYALISRRIAEEKDPIAVIDALVHLDALFAVRTGIFRPVAARYVSAAAALIRHVEGTVHAERLEIALARSAPIVDAGKKTIHGILVGPVGRAGASLFAERILGRVLRKRVKKVHLTLRTDLAFAAELRPVTTALCSDLQEQGVKVEMDEQFVEGFDPPPPSPRLDRSGIDNEGEKYYTGAGSGRNMEIQGSKAG